LAASSGDRPLAAIAAHPPRRAASEGGSVEALCAAVAPLVARASAATSARAAAGDRAVADRRAARAAERATASAVSRGKEARACAARRSSCEAMQAATLFSEGAEGGGREERAVREKEVAVEGRLDGFLTRSIDRNRRMLLRLFSQNAKTPSSRSK